MANKKKIPCRVCGKLFIPCSYCDTHSNVFRWRNFACSIECAKKYIDKTIAYRKYSKSPKEQEYEVSKIDTSGNVINKTHTATKRKVKKITSDVINN